MRDRPGLVHSPAGWVPREWEITKLSTVAAISYGISDPLDKSRKNGVPIIGMPNITKDGRFNWGERFYVAPERVIEKVKLRKGDLLFNWRNGSKDHLGKTAFFNADGEFTHVGFLLKIRCGKRVLPGYADAYLKFIKQRGYFLKAKIQVNNTFNKEELSSVPIVVPTLREQQKVIEVLQTWDEAIEKIEAMIHLAEHQVSAVRQHLFESVYRSRKELERARAIFETISEKARPDLPLLAVMQDIGIVRRDELDRRVAMPDGETSGYKVVQPGNFVISLRSFEGGLELSNVLGLVSPAYTVLRPTRTICLDYFKHFFKSRSFIGRLDKMIFGIRDGKQIAFRDFGDMHIPCPSMEVQKAHALILNAAAKTIETNHKLETALEDQKRGLMQKLVTGEWRVKC